MSISGETWIRFSAQHKRALPSARLGLLKTAALLVEAEVGKQVPLLISCATRGLLGNIRNLSLVCGGIIVDILPFLRCFTRCCWQIPLFQSKIEGWLIGAWISTDTHSIGFKKRSAHCSPLNLFSLCNSLDYSPILDSTGDLTCNQHDMEVDTQKPAATPDSHADTVEHAPAKPPATGALHSFLFSTIQLFFLHLIFLMLHLHCCFFFLTRISQVIKCCECVGQYSPSMISHSAVIYMFIVSAPGTITPDPTNFDIKHPLQVSSSSIAHFP